MKTFGINEIEEGCESRVGTVEAEDIYELQDYLSLQQTRTQTVITRYLK